jgi:hypothetical protein
MNIRASRFLVPVVTTILLLVSADTYFAQKPKEQDAGNNPTSQARILEPDKETAIRKTLGDLLAGVGVRVENTVPASDAHTHKEIQIRWQSSGVPRKAGASLESWAGPGAVTLLGLTKRDGILPRERSVELSTNQILVAALDASGGLRWWRLLLDPRLIRAESAGPKGDLRGVDYYLPTVDFTVAYPDDPGIKELRFYHPSWTGKEFQLELISNLPVEEPTR